MSKPVSISKRKLFNFMGLIIGLKQLCELSGICNIAERDLYMLSGICNPAPRSLGFIIPIITMGLDVYNPLHRVRDL